MPHTAAYAAGDEGKSGEDEGRCLAPLLVQQATSLLQFSCEALSLPGLLLASTGERRGREGRSRGGEGEVKRRLGRHACSASARCRLDTSAARASFWAVASASASALRSSREPAARSACSSHAVHGAVSADCPWAAVRTVIAQGSLDAGGELCVRGAAWSASWLRLCTSCSRRSASACARLASASARCAFSWARRAASACRAAAWAASRLRSTSVAAFSDEGGVEKGG